MSMAPSMRSPIPEEVSDSRRECTDALSLFFQHAQHALRLQLGVLTAVATVLGVAAAIGGINDELLGLALVLFGLVLVAMVAVSATSVKVLKAHYNYYIYSLILSAEMHHLSGIPIYGWGARIIPSDTVYPMTPSTRQALASELLAENSSRHSISTLSSYTKLLRVMGILTALVGLGLVLVGLVFLLDLPLV